MKVTETEVVSCGMDDHVMISQLDGIEKTALVWCGGVWCDVCSVVWCGVAWCGVM